MKPRRTGYILPMTLTLLALASLAMAGLCRQCLTGSLRVSQEQNDLQDKWGMLSCQATLLNGAQRILAQRRAASVDIELRFGGRDFRVLLADEQSRINVNRVYHLHGRSAVDRLVRDAQRASGVSIPVRLRPLAHAGAGPAFASFGQIFADGGSLADARALRVAVRSLTCWGDGRLNYRRADESTIRMLVSDDPALAQRIIQLRQSVPSVAQSLSPLNLQNRDGHVIDGLLTDTSSCFSAWTEMTRPGEAAIHFAVLEAGADGRTHITGLAW